MRVEALGESPELVELGPGPEPPPAALRLVKEIWEKELAREGAALRPGRIFSAVECRGARFCGRFVDYARWLAQLREPGLFEVLQVRPLAVAGVTWVEDGVLLGRRSARALQHPGLFECAPAGSIDPGARRGGRVSAESQLLAELEEELDLPAAWVEAPRPLAAVEDPASRVTDLCFELRVTAPRDAVRARFEARFGGWLEAEYQELRWVPRAELAAWARDPGSELAPESRALLRSYSASWAS